MEQFKPDTELVLFAKDFSNKYKQLPKGTYVSENGTYKIEYFKGKIEYFKGLINDEIPRIIVTPARINRDTGLMQFSKKQLLHKEITSNWIFYLVIWCVFRRNCTSDIECDLQTLNWYLTTKDKNVKDVINGYVIMFSNADTKNNRYRFELICSKLKKFIKKLTNKSTNKILDNN